MTMSELMERAKKNKEIQVNKSLDSLRKYLENVLGFCLSETMELEWKSFTGDDIETVKKIEGKLIPLMAKNLTEKFYSSIMYSDTFSDVMVVNKLKELDSVLSKKAEDFAY